MGWNRLVFRTLGPHAWGAFGTLAACTTPSFEASDTEEAGAPTGDAAPTMSTQCGSWPDDAALPAGAVELVGLYAARFDAFGFDDIATIRAREHEQRIVTVEIVERAGQLEMDLRTCDWQSNYESLGTLLTAHAAPLGLDSLPGHTLRMRFGPGCSWSARPVRPLLWGYDASSPAQCTPGAPATPSAEQGWLLGSCSCPMSDQSMPLDDLDCRISDPDGDGHPGVTIEWQNEELGREVYYVAMRDESQLVDGAIHGDHTLTARELRMLVSSHLGGDFPRVPTRCPDSTSRVTLKRLALAAGADVCDVARRAFWVEARQPFPERECVEQ